MLKTSKGLITKRGKGYVVRFFAHPKGQWSYHSTLASAITRLTRPQQVRVPSLIVWN